MPASSESPRRADVIYASTEHSADQLYFGRVHVPDAFLAMGVRGRRIAVVSALEYGRLAKESAFHDVLALEEWQTRAKAHYTHHDVGMAEVVQLLMREYGVEALRVAYDFPAGLALNLRANGVRLEVAKDSLFEGRLCKNEEEAKAIAEGNAASAAGFREVRRILRAARAGKDGKLRHEGKVLTAERLRTVIDTACLQRGALATGTIVAGGDQACDPHERGHGPLRANELIIVDIFPRIPRTGYHGDMTRTFLKGRPSPEQRRLVETVAAAQKAALGKIKAGVKGSSVHRAVESHFEEAGYRTGRRDGNPQGFFHSTGHGLGLEVHEAPRLGRNAGRLRKGVVVTVEPGLYYPGLGGCRIEDVVWVQTGGAEMLSKAPYSWVIR